MANKLKQSAIQVRVIVFGQPSYFVSQDKAERLVACGHAVKLNDGTRTIRLYRPDRSGKRGEWRKMASRDGIAGSNQHTRTIPTYYTMQLV